MKPFSLHPGSEIEFLRKNNNRNLHKNKKIRSIKIRSVHIVFTILIFLLAGYSAFRLGKFITGWKVLDVQTYNLVNSPVFMKHRIKNILKKYHGNILTMNISKLRDELKSIREVKDVDVSRKLPSTLTIRFFLRRPEFQVKKNHQYYLMDREGVMISKTEQPVQGLININGIHPSLLKRLSSGLPEISSMKGLIEYISYKKPYGIVMKLKTFDELFYTGGAGFKKNLERYFKIRTKLTVKDNRIVAVDLRFRDRLYLEFEKEVI